MDDDKLVLTLILDDVLLSDEGTFMCMATVVAENYVESKTTFFTLKIIDYCEFKTLTLMIIRSSWRTGRKPSRNALKYNSPTLATSVFEVNCSYQSVLRLHICQFSSHHLLLLIFV